MWNQSPSASFGALLQHIAQSNPQVFQAIMQMAAQRQQGTGGIGSLPPAQGGPMPQGGLWGQTGQRPTNPLPYAQRFNASPMPAASAQMPTSYDGGNTYGMSSGPKQGTGGIGSLPPAQGGPMPQGGLWGQTGQRPTNPLPYAQRFNTNPGPGYPAIPMPTGVSIANQTPYTPPAYSSPMPGWSQPTGPKFYPPSGPKQYGPTQPSYTPPTGPKQWGNPEPYTAPTGPKVYGQTTPAQPPAFAPSQPKVYPQPAPMAGDGTSGLDWYAQQAGN